MNRGTAGIPCVGEHHVRRGVIPVVGSSQAKAAPGIAGGSAGAFKVEVLTEEIPPVRVHVRRQRYTIELRKHLGRPIRIQRDRIVHPAGTAALKPRPCEARLVQVVRAIVKVALIQLLHPVRESGR